MTRSRQTGDSDASLFLFDIGVEPVRESGPEESELEGSGSEESELKKSGSDAEAVVAGEQVQSADVYTPPDAAERSRALDPSRSFLVQAPAGSGKTQLLTQRFLRLLGNARKPEEIVAITFTNAAAAEMRYRILGQLEQAEARAEIQAGASDRPDFADEPDRVETLAALATRAMARSRQLGWQLLEQPSQLRILTIDAFCRSVALDSPLDWGQLSGLGGRLEPSSDGAELYRRAASELIGRLLSDLTPDGTLENVPAAAETRRSVEALLNLRDNHWKDLESLLVKMLDQRNRWFQDFVFDRDPDWVRLRKRLEASFCRAAQKKLDTLADLLDMRADGRERVSDLARFACENGGEASPVSFREREELLDLLRTRAEFKELELLEDAIEAHSTLAKFLLTAGKWRKPGGLQTKHGFPSTPEGREAKELFGRLVDDLDEVAGLEAALAELAVPTPTRYTESEWNLIQHCFRVLRAAAVELQLIFAQTGSVDFTEVAQIALRMLTPENGFPPDFAIRQADGIHHLLIDEFQDTSRSQHQLLSSLIAAWPDREGRSCFLVGDPMQSIYGFRQAEVELFERLKTHGLEMPPGLVGNEANAAFRFEFIALRANFRTTPSLVDDLNGRFERIFATDDGSGVLFSPATAARPALPARGVGPMMELRLAFTARKCSPEETDPLLRAGSSETTRKQQLAEMVTLIQSKLAESDRLRELAEAGAQGNSQKYRIAVLGRTKKSLILIADALRKAKISYRAIELVPLAERPEVLDALSLARALMNPADRTAWLGVLRAPWCGLTLEQLHLITSADDSEIAGGAVPALLESRLQLLFEAGQLDARAYASASRVSEVLSKALASRATLPGLGASLSLGTWLEAVWKALGGEDTVNAEQRANLRLLWAAIDQLPAGELDLMSSALPAALGKLCALPDPAASSDYGVQLMTIHKSKGLEFEVVLVPDLESSGQKGETSLISWLERGLVEAESDELTEFLIAPIQPKGEKRGMAKEWVDRVKRQREEQELRRLIYVAATRAREELYLFARPTYTLKKAEKGLPARPALSKASGMVATAWPALHLEVEARFEEWVESLSSPLHETGGEPVVPGDGDPGGSIESRNGLIVRIAAEGAQGASNLVQMPSPALTWGQPPAQTAAQTPDKTDPGIVVAPGATRPTLLRRLPEGYRAPEFGTPSAAQSGGQVTGRSAIRLINDERETASAGSKKAISSRSEGGLESRLEGIAIHSFLERLSGLRMTLPATQAGRKLADHLSGVTAVIRGYGLTLVQAQRLAGEALTVAQRTLLDPTGGWILSPHPGAATEARWTGIIQGGLSDGHPRNLRADRVFMAAPPEFLSHDDLDADTSIRPGFADKPTAGWWIIDYKTTHADGTDFSALASSAARLAFLEKHREQHVQQLSLYADFLRNLNAHEESSTSDASKEAPVSIYAGLYYPRLRLFDFWKT